VAFPRLNTPTAHTNNATSVAFAVDGCGGHDS
jgi:hypothetical protein